MIKGAQKQMIVVRTGDSRFFDEAYFVLRREVEPARANREDILNEANRILRESAGPPQRQIPWRGLISFLAGIICGGGVCALICLLLL